MRLRYERRVVLAALLGPAPVALVALILAFAGDFPMPVKWMGAGLIALSSLAVTYRLHQEVIRRFRTMTSIIVTMWFYTAARSEWSNDGQLYDFLNKMTIEVDALTDLMDAREIDAAEGAALLRTVVALMTQEHADANENCLDVNH